MLTIFHNPRCSKSRETLSLIKEHTEDIKIINYLDDTPTKETLIEILSLLKITPLELIRTSETIWKTEYKGNEFSDEELIDLMITHPKLIERPIVINGNKAIIGRPPTNVIQIL